MAQLINKDALVAWIKSLKSAAETMLTGKTDLSYWEAQRCLCERFLSFIDTLEVKEISDKYDGFFGKELKMIDDEINRLERLKVKEVDLEKELIEWHKKHFKKDGTFIRMSGFYLTNNSQMDIAKHFFELGLQSTLTEEDMKLIWTIGDDLPYMPEEDFYKELLKRYKAKKGE